jgi:hypothetical protein
MLGYPRRNHVRDHVRLLGIFGSALSALDGMMGVASYVVANTIFNLGTQPDRPAFLHPLLSLIATVVIVKVFAGFVAGWGLRQCEPWARTVAVVLASPSLFFNVLFGTALGAPGNHLHKHLDVTRCIVLLTFGSPRNIF